MKMKIRFDFAKKTLPQLLLRLTPILILIGQNVVVFQRHYFQDYGFPWDFSQGYYGFTAFWTTLVSQGVYPTWVPFDSMGMPFDLVLQSGSHYPLLWVFPFFKIEYSLHAAVVFQCMHVLFGAIGMYLFLQLIFQDDRNGFLYALLGAFVFQFFGGVYSNAEHPDIIRAFSLMPWLFYLFTIPKVNTYKISLRYFFIPLMILLVVTGSYPGNLISSVLVMCLYVSFQLINLWLIKPNLSAFLHLSSFLVVMGILGVGLAVFHLGPSFLYKDYLTRSNEMGSLSFFTYSLGVEHLPALFLDNAVVPGEISMTSTFLTIPVLILVSYLPLKIVKEHWPMAFITGFSVLMVAGARSFFWFVLTKYINILRLSRFPSSDYRIFIAIGLICFSVLSARALIEGDVSWKGFLFRTGLVFLWFFQGIYVSYPALRSDPVYKAVVIFLISVLYVAVLVFFYRKYSKMQMIFIVLIFLILISWDAFRVLPSMGSWQLGSSSEYYKTFQWPLEENGKLLTYKIIQNTPNSRPARTEKDNFLDYSWDSYIIGQYTLDNFSSPGMLENNNLILKYPKYKKFMLEKWEPLFFKYPQDAVKDSNIEISRESMESAFRFYTDSNLTRISQTSYGINEITYDVSLNIPSLMVENEIYFPGWTAVLVSGQETSKIQAVSVNGLFRAWLLPVGNYNMVARFEFPYTYVYNGISMVALLIWVFLLFRFGRMLEQDEVFTAYSY